MTKEERINALIDMMVELGMVILVDEPQPVTKPSDSA